MQFRAQQLTHDIGRLEDLYRDFVEEASNQAEYDVTVDYRPAWREPAFLKALWFRARSAILDQQDAKTLGYQFRLIINWEGGLI